MDYMYLNILSTFIHNLSSPLSHPLSGLLKQHNNTIEAQSHSYTPNFFGSAPMWSKVGANQSLLILCHWDVIQQVSLCNATQQDLLLKTQTLHICNSTLRILGLMPNLQNCMAISFLHSTTNVSYSYRKVYATLVTGPRATHNVTMDEIQDTVPLDPKGCPAIKYWQKHNQRKEWNRHEEFKSGTEPRCRGRCKPKSKSEEMNDNFWHFQNDDSTEMSGKDLGKVQAKTKRIRRMITSTGSSCLHDWQYPPTHQLKFYLKIEAKFLLLQPAKSLQSWVHCLFQLLSLAHHSIPHLAPMCQLYLRKSHGTSANIAVDYKKSNCVNLI